MTEATRAWGIVCQYLGQETFIFGTVFVPVRAPQHELETEALRALDAVFPTRPKVLNYRPGMLVFVDEAGSRPPP
mgnify:CR=1 FL=1